MFQKIILGVGAIGLLYLGYTLFMQGDQFALEEGATNPLADAVLVKTQVFIERRAQLDQVSIDGGLFADERFTSLRSYTAALANQEVGKTSLFEVPTGSAGGNGGGE